MIFAVAELFHFSWIAKEYPDYFFRELWVEFHFHVALDEDVVVPFLDYWLDDLVDIGVRDCMWLHNKGPKIEPVFNNRDFPRLDELEKWNYSLDQEKNPN